MTPTEYLCHIARQVLIKHKFLLDMDSEDAAHTFRIRTLQITEGPKIKFVSFEPLLGPISKPDLTGINQIIIGGESGENPRAMKVEWAQDLIDWTRTNYPDCAIFFKQMGGKGKDGAGGDIINGQQFHEYPQYQNK
jgi:protein gp37